MTPKKEGHGKVDTVPVLSDEELATLNDLFPDGVFDPIHWSAETVAGVTATRALIDSFHLVGKRILNVWTESYDYFHGKDDLEESVFSDLMDRLRLPEDVARAGSSIDALEERAEVPRQMEIDTPFVIEFDTRETFEMDVEIAPTYRISMNKIPVRLLKGKCDNVDPGVMFSPVVGHAIIAVDFKTVPEGGSDDSVQAILFRLDNGLTLELEGFFDYLDVSLLDHKGKPCTGSIASLRDGLREIMGRSPCEGKGERVAPVR